MSYATLVVARTRYDVVEVMIDGSRAAVRKDAAALHYEAEMAPHKAQYESALATVRDLRDQFTARAKVDRSVQVKRDTGGLRKERLLVDRVVLEGQIHELPPKTADSFLTQQARKRFPEPELPEPETFESWWQRRKVEQRGWVAEFVTSVATTPLPMPADMDWKWGYPISAALELLDGLHRDGWSLMHVSEDRGLYQGEDARQEAYPTRVRYLLRR